jgi:hypothetical protein
MSILSSSVELTGSVDFPPKHFSYLFLAFLIAHHPTLGSHSPALGLLEQHTDRSLCFQHSPPLTHLLTTLCLKKIEIWSSYSSV